MSVPSLGMDVTGQELRDVDIRDALRGYAREEVDALLERAAETIDELEQHLRALQQQQRTPAPHANGGARERGASPSPVSVGDSARVGKTLLDAQTAADQTIAEAQTRAQQLISDSEAKAEEVVAEARSKARDAADDERHGVETEICELAERRDALNADADTLEHLGTDYRDRIRDALSIDLVHLDDSPPFDDVHAEEQIEESASARADG